MLWCVLGKSKGVAVLEYADPEAADKCKEQLAGCVPCSSASAFRHRLLRIALHMGKACACKWHEAMQLA